MQQAVREVIGKTCGCSKSTLIVTDYNCVVETCVVLHLLHVKASVSG